IVQRIRSKRLTARTVR
ncbi:thermolysin metallopeptidase, catalytic domain protein, partial [Vibrio parahaemolyticus V-223/04]